MNITSIGASTISVGFRMRSAEIKVRRFTGLIKEYDRYFKRLKKRGVIYFNKNRGLFSVSFHIRIYDDDEDRIYSHIVKHVDQHNRSDVFINES